MVIWLWFTMVVEGHIYIWFGARFRRARKSHFFQYVCAMTYYIQAHHATSLHNLPKPHVWQCVCVMQFSINFIMELAYATLQHCINHVSSTFFTLSPCHIWSTGGSCWGGRGAPESFEKVLDGGGGQTVFENVWWCLQTFSNPPPSTTYLKISQDLLTPPPTLKSKLCWSCFDVWMLEQFFSVSSKHIFTYANLIEFTFRYLLEK